MDFLDIALIRDTRTGKYARIPKVCLLERLYVTLFCVRVNQYGYIYDHTVISVCLSLSLCLSVSLHWKRHQFAAPLSLSLSFCLYIVISCLNCYFSCSAFNRGHLVTVQYYLIQAKDENIIHLPGWGLYAAFTTEVSLTAAHVP